MIYFKKTYHHGDTTKAIEKDPSAASKWLSYKSFKSSLSNKKNMLASFIIGIENRLSAVFRWNCVKILCFSVVVVETDNLLVLRHMNYTFKLHSPFFDRIHFHGVQIAQIIVSLLVRCSHLERCKTTRGVTSSKCWIWSTCKNKSKID